MPMASRALASLKETRVFGPSFMPLVCVLNSIYFIGLKAFIVYLACCCYLLVGTDCVTVELKFRLFVVMFQNKEKQEYDLETGLLNNCSKFESKPPDEFQLKIFRMERKSEGSEQEIKEKRERKIWSSAEFFDKQAESDDGENELLEYENILENMTKYKKKIRTVFNAIGALKTGSESKSNANQAMKHDHYQRKWTALHHASAKGLFTLIQDLLNSGDEPNVTDERGRTAIDVAGIAFYQGLHIESLAKVLQTLLQGNGRFNTMKEKKDCLDTPIHTAVELGCTESIKILINAGASVACLNSFGLTPLHLCIKSQQEECFKTLLKHRCNDSEAISKRANTEDYAGFKVLQAAVVIEWVQGVNILLDAGADVTAGSDLPFDRYNNVTVEDFSNFVYRLEQIHETPIHLAADVGNKDILRKLLNKNKSAVNKYNLIGQTPLYIAIRGGYIDCIKILLNIGANLMSVTNENENALHIAIKFNQIKVFVFLLDHDYDVANKMLNCFDNNGYAPIHSATMCNRVECIKLLAEKNFYLRLLTNGELIEDWSPLHIAAAKNFPEVAEIILKYDEAAIDDVDHKGRLPIHIAASRRNREVMAMLLRKGAVLSSHTDPVQQKGLKGFRKNRKTTTLKMISSELPNSTEFLEEVFDSFIEPNINTEGHRIITMDYGLFTKVNSVSQIKVLEELVEYGHEKLLIHPLMESLIYLKWKSLFPAFGVIICIHSLFALSLCGQIIGDFICNDVNDADDLQITVVNGFGPFTATLVIVVTLLELLYINIQRRRYFCQLESWVKLGTIFLAFILLSAGETSWTEEEFFRHAATAALLLSWAQIMFLFSRFPNIGFYVLIFGHVSLIIFKILCVFSFLIIAFALCFMIQYHSQPPFSGPWEAIIKTIVMMTSEFDYEDIFGEDHMELSSSKPLVHLLFILFLIFVSIVFVNFMVGVAVSDVNDLKVEGNIRRLEKQVEFLNTLDVLAFGLGFKCWAENYCASKSFISKRFVNSMTIKAGITKTWMVCYETKMDDEITMFEKEISLPSHILDNIFNKVNSAKEQNKEEKEFYMLREQVHFIYNFTAGFIDRFLTNEKDLTREIRIDKTSYRLKPKSVEDFQELKDNVPKIKYCSKNRSTQSVPTETRILSPKYLGTRMYFTKQFRTKRTIKRNRLLHELKSKFTEEATAFRNSQLKRFKKLERMLKKL